jgi:hypothetical protein
VTRTSSRFAPHGNRLERSNRPRTALKFNTSRTRRKRSLFVFVNNLNSLRYVCRCLRYGRLRFTLRCARSVTASLVTLRSGCVSCCDWRHDLNIIDRYAGGATNNNEKNFPFLHKYRTRDISVQ